MCTKHNLGEIYMYVYTWTEHLGYCTYIYVAHHDFSIWECCEISGSDGGRLQTNRAQISREVTAIETDPILTYNL